ncbi:RsmB/NOP family class I SAM-dependent RNA methyltransferase (plasmid) [Pseudorhodobacter turbinis]|uniref:RsmB/NOP family class I SAM-dependent RNA methyltransferase n=1 Tax=Pseudorhodobacter turbinis TaxID=2500533 RepID=A0A4P8EIQ6_9RHOB|nr:RsmB/NOP family class I SAM-dependent RNA methyltransferase [Pseudorhodobacter turbinis]QCO56847.1 RsmB/NOP family class I SAM-dependent RNA methyltransferase [Pseudorhodobacter turbinis]
MTPAARYAAAIEILDKVVGGEVAEKALTNWARGNRFAGSGDRHALRDIVFDVLRCKRSFAVLGGEESGRGLVLGALRAAGIAPDTVFTEEGYAPAVLTPSERACGTAPDGLAALDCPDWLAPELRASLGEDFVPVMQALQSRAPVFLRVNLRKGDLVSAGAALRAEGIETQPASLAKTSLEVLSNPRRIQNSNAFKDGLVELQDAASQAITEMLPLDGVARVLDFCAGGGGKSLAMAARSNAQIYAHDIAPTRMKDLPVRAKRAGVRIEVLAPPALKKAAPFDLVLADAPCSGSGSWRRAPEAKWALTPERLSALHDVQAQIMDEASRLVLPGGIFAYATCSLLRSENQAQVAAFLGRNPGWSLTSERVLTPLDGGDGFFVAWFRRNL